MTKKRKPKIYVIEWGAEFTDDDIVRIREYAEKYPDETINGYTWQEILEKYFPNHEEDEPDKDDFSPTKTTPKDPYLPSI